jgi:hypothetical protein
MADNLLLDRLKAAHRELKDAMEMLIHNKDYAEAERLLRNVDARLLELVEQIGGQVIRDTIKVTSRPHVEVRAIRDGAPGRGAVQGRKELKCVHLAMSSRLRPCFSLRWPSRNSNQPEPPQRRLSSATLWTEARQSPLKLQRSCSMEPYRATDSWCSRGETTA